MDDSPNNRRAKRPPIEPALITPPVLSRREFVAGGLVAGAGIWISAALPRPLAAAESRESVIPVSLTRSEWAVVEALTARLIPTDEAPGAREANCVNFIDKALANEDGHALPFYRSALRELDRLCRERFEQPFVGLTDADQDTLITQLELGTLPGWAAEQAEPTAFFETIRMHTILGFVLDPSYGGNRDYAGWKAMGFPGPVHHLGGSQPDQMLGEREFVPIWERGKRDGKRDKAPGEKPGGKH